MTRLLRALGVTALVSTAMLGSTRASACAVCGAADTTLSPRGEEAAFQGRVRATLDARVAGLAALYAPLRIQEWRLVPGVAVALDPDVLVSVDAPLLRRSLSLAEDARTNDTEAFMLGDAEARVSYVAQRSRRHRVAFRAGVKAPTAPLERDGTGAYVPTDLQPGCGAITPNVGTTFTVTGSLVSFWANAALFMPVSVRGGPHSGDSLRASTTAQVQPVRAFAVRLGAHGRLDAAGDVDGEIDARSGGASLFLTPEIATNPASDLVITVGASIPIVQETRGHRVTAPIALLGVGFDF